jgi:hypothetical protein
MMSDADAEASSATSCRGRNQINFLDSLQRGCDAMNAVPGAAESETLQRALFRERRELPSPESSRLHLVHTLRVLRVAAVLDCVLHHDQLPLSQVAA